MPDTLHPIVVQLQSPPASDQQHPILIALLAAFGAIIGVILKDFIFKLMEERRARDSTMRAVYAKYADPLSSSAVSLMWRLNEALNEPGRGGFLKLVGIPSSTNSKYSIYGSYKKLSTLYRLAVLLGWIRACRREFSYLKVAEPGSLKPVEEAIGEFEKALADGPAVEIERLSALCKLWGFESPLNENKKSWIGVELEAAIDEFMQQAKVDEINDLSNEQLRALAESAAKMMTDSLNLQTVPRSVLDQTSARAIQILDFKEAWIYRDWQSAIGDLMIRPVERSERCFEVISFNDFESISCSSLVEQKRWVARLSSVFDGIDLSRKDPYDHRPTQLRKVLRAAASLTLALSSSAVSTNPSIETLSLARKIQEAAVD